MDWIKNLFRGVKITPAASTPTPPTNASPTTEQVDALRKRFGHLARPAVHIRPGGSGFTRLGGLPCLPDDLAWPEFNGRPQSFLAQLDVAEINAVMPSFLPARGYLYFFYDQDQGVWGFDPKDRDGWRVLYTDRDPAEFRERAAPVGLEAHARFRPKFVTPHRVEVMPSTQRLPREEYEWSRDGDAYDLLSEPAFAGQTRHQMFGYPSPVQNDAMEEECQFASNGVYCGDSEGWKSPATIALRPGAADWRLLLQLDSDDDTGWMWGDVGTVYFWIREQDARKGDFSKTWMIFQCC